MSDAARALMLVLITFSFAMNCILLDKVESIQEKLVECIVSTPCAENERVFCLPERKD